MKKFTVLLISLLLCQPAAAHYIWIEQDRLDAKHLYFGEVEEGLRETSPGRLDDIRSPLAHSPTGPMSVVRRENHFYLGASRPGTPAVASELGFEVRDWTKSGLGIVKPMYYARYSTQQPDEPAIAQLPLDIRPVPGKRDAFVVTFRGQPLAKTKVTVVAPNTWTQEHRSDDAGQVFINLPWRGMYLLQAIHTEQAPGEFNGARFQVQRHRATLTFVSARGEPVRDATPPGRQGM